VKGHGHFQTPGKADLIATIVIVILLVFCLTVGVELVQWIAEIWPKIKVSVLLFVGIVGGSLLARWYKYRHNKD